MQDNLAALARPHRVLTLFASHVEATLKEEEKKEEKNEQGRVVPPQLGAASLSPCFLDGPTVALPRFLGCRVLKMATPCRYSDLGGRRQASLGARSARPLRPEGKEERQRSWLA